MKNESLYNKTVDILVDAYFNDTLEHGNCYACAVGNMIAGNCGYSFLRGSMNHFELNVDNTEVIVYTGLGFLYWDQHSDFYTNPVKLLDKGLEPDIPENKKQVEHITSTGYTLKDLAKIEMAFEGANPMRYKSDKYMFNRLMSVIDQLDIIHDNKDANVSAVTKQRFVKQI